jgi:hypothetical protein
MTNADLQDRIAALGVNSTELALLTGVSSRAVALWLAGDRGVPGPIAAYLRVLAGSSEAVRQNELATIRRDNRIVIDGLYMISYHSGGNAGYGVLVFDNGRVYGGDPGQGQYDGEYVIDAATGLANVSLKLSFPANVPAVFGLLQFPVAWSTPVTGTLDPRVKNGHLTVRTELSPDPIEVDYVFMRSLPDAA